eukprot:gene13085-biopygen20000
MASPFESVEGGGGVQRGASLPRLASEEILGRSPHNSPKPPARVQVGATCYLLQIALEPAAFGQGVQQGAGTRGRVRNWPGPRLPSQTCRFLDEFTIPCWGGLPSPWHLARNLACPSSV